MKRIFRRGWLFLALIPIVLLAGAYVWLLTLPYSGRINEVNFNRIQIGMTIGEVNEILGEDTAHPITRVWDDGHRTQAASIYEIEQNGIVPVASIWIEFEENRVVKKEFTPPSARELYDRITDPVLQKLGLRPAPSPLPMVFCPIAEPIVTKGKGSDTSKPNDAATIESGALPRR